jgi:predicted GNAT family N-acyltransferase
LSRFPGHYRSAGFTERGQPFAEAGIEHVKMEKISDLGNTY